MPRVGYACRCPKHGQHSMWTRVRWRHVPNGLPNAVQCATAAFLACMLFQGRAYATPAFAKAGGAE